ncbi:adenylate/guanylate cyclase domain-containing protein [Tomitella biformata]|uniref:adenylate/guanylate cyclase domain-containing protein n=1 Tax=Tomitella biformata TaxID=630403 RepID=UPI0004B65B2F|nr:adenylate/guanylate cyclase domain-containing protein [Tomitella biformata]
MSTFRLLVSRGYQSRWILYILSMMGANIFASAIGTVLVRWVLPVKATPALHDNLSLIYSISYAYLGVGLIISAIAAAAMLAPVVRWYARGGSPTPAEQSAVMLAPLRQSRIHLAIWLLGGALYVALTYEQSPDLAVASGAVVTLVSIGTFGTSYLLGERILRPVAARALSDGEFAPHYAPGVNVRLLLAWALGTLTPAVGVLALALADLGGFIDATPQAVGIAIIVMIALTMVTSLLLTALVSSQISDPIRQLREAILRLGRGDKDVAVSVYDGSEVGMLQVGFNRMVQDSEERRRIEQLFGQHVGVDVARRAMRNDTVLGGETRFVAVLFVDMIASTALAAARPPTEVVELLNQFFRVVVDVVHRNGGFVNKFIGDEVFAVFGAPLHRPDSPTAALRCARELHVELSRLTGIDAGVGVSAGIAVAGNVGSAERFEYTVIGDPVNEAARLTDLAKRDPSRVFASSTILGEAAAAEQRLWTLGQQIQLHGRSKVTQIAHPVGDCEVHEVV